MIPLVTNYVNVLRPANDLIDPYADVTYVLVASRVPCVVGSKSGSSNEVSGDQETVTAQAVLPADTVMGRSYRLYDPDLDETWEVTWYRARTGLGLDHLKVGLKQVTGAARV